MGLVFSAVLHYGHAAAPNDRVRMFFPQAYDFFVKPYCYPCLYFTCSLCLVLYPYLYMVGSSIFHEVLSHQSFNWISNLGLQIFYRQHWTCTIILIKAWKLKIAHFLQPLHSYQINMKWMLQEALVQEYIF